MARLIVVLSLCFGLNATAFAGAEMEAFFNSRYTLCDAHFVAKTFGFSLSDSKAYIGQKIGWGTTDILDADLQRAREKGKQDRTWRCQFHQTGLASSDAEVLATYWGISVSDAKVRVEEKILYGNERFLRDTVLPEARAMKSKEGPTDGGTEAADMAAFLNSPVYDACHAKMLVGTWFGSGLRESKAHIGFKIRNNATSMVEAELDVVRKRHQRAGTTPCEFYETRYTYDDAEALAKLWGQEVHEVKAAIEHKYAWGSEGNLKAELARAGRR